MVCLLVVSSSLADIVTTQVALSSSLNFESNVLPRVLGTNVFYCVKVAVNLALFALSLWQFRRTGARIVWLGCVFMIAFQWIAAANNVIVALNTL